MAMLVAGMQGTGLKGMAVAKNSGKSSSGSDFGVMLMGNISKQDSSQGNTQQAKSGSVVRKDDVSAPAKEGVSDAASTAKQLEKTKTASQISKSEDSGRAEVTGNEEISSTTEAEEVDAAVKEILAKIRLAVKDVLHLDEEELNLLMEQMGIMMADLLDPQVLQQFVVEAGGEDISALLANESMYGDLKQLQEMIGNIVQDSGMPKEEIMQQAVRLQDASTKELTSREDQDLESMTATLDTKENTFHFEAVRESGEDARQESGTQNRNSGTQVSQPEQFLNLVTNAASENRDETEVQFSQLTAAEQIREIADQILEKVRVIINPAQTSMEITLNPESLGRVSLNLISKQGVMTAQFTAQNQVAREAIESQITVLRENLENQGLKVEAIEVTVSNFEFTQSDGMAGQEQQGGRPQQRRNLHVEETRLLDEVTEEEALAIDILERSGNSVDYTA